MNNEKLDKAFDECFKAMQHLIMTTFSCLLDLNSYLESFGEFSNNELSSEEDKELSSEEDK